MGQSQQLVYSPLTDEARVLGDVTVRLLQGCRTAAALDEHTAALCAELGVAPAQAPAVRAQLDELAASGLLVTEQSLLERCLGSPAANIATPMISSLGIATHDRPLSLRGGLGSFAAKCRERGRSMRFLVADGSDAAEMRRENEDALRALKSQFGCAITYIDAKAKSDLCDVLSRRAEVAPDIVRFALLNDDRCPIATGGDRNALLLATAGELTLQIDDDVECAVAPGPGIAQSLTLTSAHDPTSFWPDVNEGVEGPGGGASADVFALHEQLLGKSLADCLQGCRQEDVDTNGMLMSFARRLRGNGGAVHVTSLGLAGDLGTESEFSVLCAEGPARDRLVRSVDAYRRLVQSQQGVRAVSNTTISDGAFGSGSNLGLDNREPLPPFMPVQANQDRVFIRAVHATGNGLFGHLPWTIRRSWTGPMTRQEPASASVQMGDIMEALVHFLEQSGGVFAEKNSADLGALLVELGMLPPPDFNEILQRNLWTRAMQRITALEQLLARHGRQPNFWADEVTRYLAGLRDALRGDDHAVPSDLSIVFGQEGASVLMQRLVVKFGRLLEVWPRLRETALELHLQGHPFGRSI